MLWISKSGLLVCGVIDAPAACNAAARANARKWPAASGPLVQRLLRVLIMTRAWRAGVSRGLSIRWRNVTLGPFIQRNFHLFHRLGRGGGVRVRAGKWLPPRGSDRGPGHLVTWRDWIWSAGSLVLSCFFRVHPLGGLIVWRSQLISPNVLEGGRGAEMCCSCCC